MKKIVKKIFIAAFLLTLFVGGFSISKNFNSIGQFVKISCFDGGDTGGWG